MRKYRDTHSFTAKFSKFSYCNIAIQHVTPYSNDIQMRHSNATFWTTFSRRNLDKWLRKSHSNGMQQPHMTAWKQLEISSYFIWHFPLVPTLRGRNHISFWGAIVTDPCFFTYVLH